MFTTAKLVQNYIISGTLRYFKVVPDQLSGGARRQPPVQGGGREGRGEGCVPPLVQRIQVPHAERRKATTRKYEHIRVIVQGSHSYWKTWTKWEGIFQSWKSWGILNRLEKSGKITQNTGNSGNFRQVLFVIF